MRAVIYISIISLFVFVLAVPGSVLLQRFYIETAANDDYCYSDSNAKEHQNTKDCQGFIYKTLDDPVAFFTGGLFVFTVALAVASIRLFQITKSGITNQERMTKEALEHSKGATERQLRAYITFKDVHATPIADSTIDNRLAGWAFSGEWQNVGQTPAINVECSIHTCLSIKGETVIFGYGKTADSIQVKLGPSMKFSSAIMAVSIPTLRSTIDMKKNVYVLFRTKYETTFSTDVYFEEICIKIKCVRTDFLLTSDLAEHKKFFHFEAHGTYVTEDKSGQEGAQQDFIKML